MKKQREDSIIDMEFDEEKGVYNPITPYKRPNKPDKVNIHIYHQVRVPPLYQFLDGFITGLEAIERFMRYTMKFTKEWKDMKNIRR